MDVLFHLNIKLCRKEFTVNQITFQLGNIDTVGGKSAQNLIQRRRNMLGYKHD